MILIGVTGWGDHDSLYSQGIHSRDKLKEYAGYFPTVEVDSSFYAIQPKRNSETDYRWEAIEPVSSFLTMQIVDNTFYYRYAFEKDP